MSRLPREHFIGECPFTIVPSRRKYPGGMLYSLHIYTPAGVRIIPIDPALLTARALSDFVDGILEYGNGTLAAAEYIIFYYDSDRPGIIEVDYPMMGIRDTFPFCQELLDALAELVE